MNKRKCLLAHTAAPSPLPWGWSMPHILGSQASSRGWGIKVKWVQDELEKSAGSMIWSSLGKSLGRKYHSSEPSCHLLVLDTYHSVYFSQICPHHRPQSHLPARHASLFLLLPCSLICPTWILLGLGAFPQRPCLGEGLLLGHLGVIAYPQKTGQV